jgi:predicted ATP-binding protein involved in virulence
MKVKQLSVQSFRGIGDLTIKFRETQPTVFIGVNGAGKSSILDCLAILLSHFVGRLRTSLGYKRPSADARRFFEEQDVKKGREEVYAEVSTSLYLWDEVTWSLTRRESKTVRKDVELRPVIDYIHERLDLVEANLPLVVYYPVNRTVVEIPLGVSKEEILKNLEPIKTYDGALTGKIDFSSFFAWFRQREDLENELRLVEDHRYRDNQLEVVRKAISSLLPDFDELRVRRSPLSMTISKQGQELIVNQLSDGEKCLLAMVGDLARRLAIANPGLADPLQGEGVVLIDEIELHLHPAWQREVIPALTRTFPNCQFIVTTHSPQVVSQVKPEGIYLLERTPQGVIARHPESSYGRDSNRILEDVMGVPERPQTIKDSLRQLFRLIEEGNLDSARQLQHQLEQQIGDDEPEFARADVLIRRKEILGR